MLEMFPFRNWVRSTFGRKQPVPLVDELTAEAELLTRDIVLRELTLIDDRAKIQAQREKRLYLLDWIAKGLKEPDPK